MKKFQLEFFFICVYSFLLGWYGNKVFSYSNNFTKEEINLMKSVACVDGVLDTIEYIYLKRKEPADCIYKEE